MEDKKNLLKELTGREISLSELTSKLEINELEILGIVKELRDNGINISVSKKDDDIYLFNQGERELGLDDYTYSINTGDSHEFKFIAISNPIIGSKYQQLSILEDIYKKGHDMGYDNAILCGNLTPGLYPVTNEYYDSNFLTDTMMQADYIISNYPKIDGMKTYFILGPNDKKHLTSKKKINIGKRISDARDDMIYLGIKSCTMNVDKVNMYIQCQKKTRTYTVSYRSQQLVNSFRSEDKPKIILLGGLYQMEKYTYHDIKVLSIPSVCASTKEMLDNYFPNVVGAWYITVKTDKKGQLESFNAMDSIYYKTDKKDYTKVRSLKPNNSKGGR